MASAMKTLGEGRFPEVTPALQILTADGLGVTMDGMVGPAVCRLYINCIVQPETCPRSCAAGEHSAGSFGSCVLKVGLIHGFDPCCRAY